MRRTFLFLIVLSLAIIFLVSCPALKYALTIQIGGSGTTDPSEGVHEFNKNQVVTVKAFPESCWEFDSWEGEVASPDSTTTTVTMDKSKTIKAVFVLDQIGIIIDKLDPLTPLSFRHGEELILLVPNNIQRFLNLLEDDDPLNRWAAAYALQRNQLDQSTLDDLEDYLDDENLTIRALIAVAFLLSGDESGKSVLVNLLTEDTVMMYSIPPVLLSDFAEVILNAYYPAEYPLTSFSPQTTTVSGGPCEYTVTVKVVFHGAGASETQVEAWETDAEAIWNGADDSREWGDGCCSVKFEFDFSVLAEGAQPPDDAHVVEVKKVKSSHTSWVATPLPTPGSTETTTGEWDSLDTGPVIAHEMGHMMGLDDEYHNDEDGNYVNDNPQPEGSPPSIMAQTWGGAQPLTEHFDAIMEAADIECDCDYTLTIDPPYDVNISPGSHTVTVTVAKEDGKPAKNCDLTLNITGLHPKSDVKLKTDDAGKSQYTYQCVRPDHTGIDNINVTGECGALGDAVKKWIALWDLFPFGITPFDGQEDYPYSIPMAIIFGVEPALALEA
ncbi:InlB B-repeat-containing protein, partial [Mesotoga prima]|uniref:InlB B-repeat-containing protein n=1 Tax=Mesotoga prima TaxID=1184387 RepID=UPI002FDB7038